MRFGLVLRVGTIAVLAILLAAQPRIHAQFTGSAVSPDSAFSIPNAQVLQPEELNRVLHAQGANKPLVLQVGSHTLFAEAHIAGSEYAGPGSQAAGLKQLQDRVAPLPRKTFIVIYCGWCPLNRGTNLVAAFKVLRGLGFANVKALYNADTLGAASVAKGYPVESGR